MGTRDSLVAQLLLKSPMTCKSKDVTLSDENVNNPTAAANCDIAIDLSHQTKEKKKQSMIEQVSTKTDLDVPNRNYSTDAQDERHYSHDGVFKCTLCPFLADSARVLFKHYNFHKHMASNLKEDSSDVTADSLKIQENTVASEVCSSPETMVPIRQTDSPSLRELLQKKENNSTPASKYLQSIVKAVLNEKPNEVSTSFNISNSTIYGNQNDMNAEEDAQSSFHNRISPFTSYSMLNPPRQYSSGIMPNISGQSIEIKDEPEWINETEINDTPRNRREGAVVFAPEPIEGYFTSDQIDTAHQRPNKRKCKPVRLRERASSIEDNNLDKHKKVKQDHMINLPKITPSSDENNAKPISGIVNVNTKDKATQCQIITPNMDKISSTDDDKQEVSSGSEECARVSSSMNQHMCVHCGIYFNDEVLYSIHMGCHSLGDAFNCNVCGKHCKDKYGFYIHIMRGHKYN